MPQYVIFVLLSVLSTLSLSLAQDIRLQGQISIHNSKYEKGQIEYVANAFISGDYATSASSDQEGRFLLLFRGISQGLSVSVQVEKEGLEVVNRRELRDLVVHQNHTIKVYMAPKGKLAQAQVELYNINLQAVTQKYEHYIDRLQTDQEAAITELEDNFGQQIADRYQAANLLEERLEATKKRLPEISKELARVNLDFASRTYQRAYEAFVRGELDSVIAILDSAKLDASVNLDELKRLKQEQNILDSAMQDEQSSVQTNIKNMLLRAQSYREAYSFDQAIHTCQQALYFLKTTQFDTVFMVQCHHFLFELYREIGRNDSALLYLQNAHQLHLAHSNPDSLILANSFQSMAEMFRLTHQFIQAETYQNQAINIFADHPTRNVEHLTVAYLKMSEIKLDLGNLELAQHYAKTAHTLAKQSWPESHPLRKQIADWKVQLDQHEDR